MEKTKNKGKKKVLLVCGILLALAVIAGGAAAVLFMNNSSASERVEYSGEVQIQDEEALRAALKTKGDCEIVLSGDVVITKELEVFGDKKLSGGSIIMDMRREGSNESVLAIQKGAKLVLDGTTVDGNSVVNCISVKAGGELDSKSGSLLYGYPYGLDVSGKVTISDILIEEALHTGINVAIFGEVDMQGGTISHNVYGIAVAEEGSMDIADGVVMTKSAASFVVNYGKMEIIGGKYDGSNDNAIENWGTMTVKGTESDPVEICNGGKSAINAKNNAKLTVEHVNIHHMGWHAMCVEKNTTATIKNVHIDTTGKSTLYVNSAKATIENISIVNGVSYGVYGTKSAEVTMTNVAIKNMGHRAVVNELSVLTADGLVIENSVQHGVYTTGDTAITTVNNATITGTERSGFAVAKGKGTITNSHIADTKRECVSVAEPGTVIVDKCTIDNAGNFGVGCYGGVANVKNTTFTNSKNASVIVQDGGTLTGENLTIKNSAKQAIRAEKGGVAKVNGCTITTTGAASVYADGAKIVLKSAVINNSKTYGVAAKNCNKASGQIIQLDNVTVNNPGEHGIGSLNGYLVAENITVNNPKRCGVYSEGDKAIINMANIKVNKAGSCGLGFKGAAEITARNVTIDNPKNEGIYAFKGAVVKKLDNITIQNPGTHGVSVEGGATVDITVDTKYNPDNTKGNGVTVLNPGKNGIRVKEATLTAKNVTIKNAGGQGISANTESKVSVDGCTIDTTVQAAVYAGESKLTLKNATVDNAGSYAVVAQNCAKEKEQILQLTNVEINKPGQRGIGSLNAYMVAKDVIITEPKTSCGVYTEGDGAILNMANIQVKNAATCGFGFTGGAEITARNVTITDPKNEGILIQNNTNVKRLDNVVVTNPGSFGLDVQGGSVSITADTDFNPDNTKKIGMTIENATRHGIVIRAGATLSAEATTIKNSGERGIYNIGTLTLVNSGVTIDEAAGHGIYMTAEAGITGSGLAIKNVGDNGIFSEGGSIDITSLAVEKTTNQGVQVKGGDVKISNFAMKEIGGVAMRVRNTTKLTLSSGTIDADTYGIYADGTSETAVANVTIVRTKNNTNPLVYLAGSAKVELGEETKLDGKKHEGNGVDVTTSTATFIMNGATFANNTTDVVLAKDATIKLQKALTEAVSVEPREYIDGLLIVEKQSSISDADFKASTELLTPKTAPWTISEVGCLSNPENMVAAIGAKTYSSLEAAVEAANASAGADVIRVLKSNTVRSQLKITGDVTITADEAITVTADFANSLFNITSGTVAITGASESAKITFASGVKTTNIVYNNGGTVSLTNVELAGNTNSTAGNNSTYGIYNNAGKVTAKSVTIKDIVKGDGINIRAGASLDLDNVSISNTSRYGLKSYGTVNVYNTVHADKALSISNTNDHAVDLDNGGKLISNLTNVPTGTYAITINTTTKSSARGILIRAGASAKLTDVSIKNTKSFGLDVLAATSTGSLSGFEIAGTNADAVNLTGSATLSNGKISASTYGINLTAASASLTMGGVAVSGNTADIYLAKTTKIILTKPLTADTTVAMEAYEEGAVVAQKGAGISDADFEASMALLIPEDTNWVVAATGKLGKSACDHNWSEQITTQPTCTTDGVKTHTCSKCGNSYTEQIVATGHTVKHVAFVAPSLEAAGNKEYWYCSVCNTIWEDAAQTKVTDLASVTLPKVAAGNVAYMNGEAFQTLEAAVTKANEDATADTIYLLSDVTVSKQLVSTTDMTITAAKAVTITAVTDNWSGNNNTMIVVAGGMLTISGASEDGKITIAAGKKTTRNIDVTAGKVELTNVALIGNSATTQTASNATVGLYVTAGKAIAKRVTVQGIPKGDGIYVAKGAFVDVDDVTISNISRYGVAGEGAVNVYNTQDTENALTISNTGNHCIDVKDKGTFRSHFENVAADTYLIKLRNSGSSGIIVRQATLDVTNISISNAAKNGIWVHQKATVSSATVKNAKIEKAGEYAIRIEVADGALVVENVTVDSCGTKVAYRPEKITGKITVTHNYVDGTCDVCGEAESGV